MNGDELDINDFGPSFLQDGLGIQGEGDLPVDNPFFGPDEPLVQEFDAEDERQSGGGGGGGGLTVTVEDASGFVGGGVGEVDNVTTLTFDSNVFEIYDGGGGQVVIKIKTCDASCP